MEELKRYVEERFVNVDHVDLPPDLVFFNDVVRHIARLSRVMVRISIPSFFSTLSKIYCSVLHDLVYNLINILIV